MLQVLIQYSKDCVGKKRWCANIVERRVENKKAIFPRLVALFSLFRREPLLCQVAVTLAEVLGYSHYAKACPRQS